MSDELTNESGTEPTTAPVPTEPTETNPSEESPTLAQQARASAQEYKAPVFGDKPAVPAYHTQETWAAAKDRTEEVNPVEPKGFAYSYNGYDVKAVEATGGTRGDENGLVYEITQGDFKKTVVEKQDAINFVQTHSSDYAKNA